MIGFEIFIGIFFVLACAAYWIFEREHAVRLVTSLLPRPRRKVVRDTWDLIDAKLGAYVRGQALLITLVATTLSLLFWAIGLPFWLLVGVFAGFVEIVPVIGPLTAGAVAVGVGLTESIQLGIAAGVIVLVVRLLEDYIVIPKVLGEAVGLSPLLVLVSVTATAILFGEGRGAARHSAGRRAGDARRRDRPRQGSRRGRGADCALPGAGRRVKVLQGANLAVRFLVLELGALAIAGLLGLHDRRRRAALGARDRSAAPGRHRLGALRLAEGQGRRSAPCALRDRAHDSRSRRCRLSPRPVTRALAVAFAGARGPQRRVELPLE